MIFTRLSGRGLGEYNTRRRGTGVPPVIFVPNPLTRDAKSGTGVPPVIFVPNPLTRDAKSGTGVPPVIFVPNPLTRDAKPVIFREIDDARNLTCMGAHNRCHGRE